MLVLSRKNGQKIIINDNIEITILDAKYDNCKVAISAPRDVKIYREEVYRQIQMSNSLSNKSSVDELKSISDIAKNDAEQSIQHPKNRIIIKKKQ